MHPWARVEEGIATRRNSFHWFELMHTDWKFNQAKQFDLEAFWNPEPSQNSADKLENVGKDFVNQTTHF